MISKDLDQQFCSWTDLVDGALAGVPEDQGVYVFRLKGGKVFGRLRGESDILYIGSTKKGLRSRIYQYLHPGPTQWTNIRVGKLREKYQIELSWSKDRNPKAAEHNLLVRYFRDHDELPPLNHADVKTLTEAIADPIGVRDSVGAWVGGGKQDSARP